jgi:hypothetical protein
MKREADRRDGLSQLVEDMPSGHGGNPWLGVALSMFSFCSSMAGRVTQWDSLRKWPGRIDAPGM